jgi:uncharacterized flavoprotein (TIGR03862 family)
VKDPFEIAVIGGGPAGLMAADVLSATSAAAGRPLTVTIYDGMPSVGRKLLMAGRGGLNLTHSEDFAAFLGRYGQRRGALEPAIAAWTPADVRRWCEDLGQPTFVGSSGRIFPRAMKASPLLRAWLRRLGERGVRLHTRHRWLGWDPSGALRFETTAGEVAIAADATILALGGASWPRLGSDGAWVAPLRAAGVEVAPLQPTNCGFRVAWSTALLSRYEGAPLKRIALSCNGHHARGEAVITAEGIEGGAVYALSGPIRDAIEATGPVTITIDLRPDVDAAALAMKLNGKRDSQSLSTFLRKHAGLSPAAIGLVQEALHNGSSTSDLAALVKALPLRLLAPRPIGRAISSAGGLRLSAMDGHFMLRDRPGVFAAGEMLDWEAPTGGYLLQACFSTGRAAAQSALAWLAERA